MALPELEFRCWRCWGSGLVTIEDHGTTVECSECGGIGWIPTEDGKRLLDFLQRHMSVDLGEDEGEEAP